FRERKRPARRIEHVRFRLDQIETPRFFELLVELRDERRAIARMRMERALPRRFPDDVDRFGKQQLLSVFVRREQSARVIEMQMREDADVDVLVLQAYGGERREK